MKALVTGADGFVGGHLAALLLREGIAVHGTTLGEDPGGRSLSAHDRARIDWHPLDVLDAPAVAEVLRSVAPDLLFHLAGLSSGARARSAPARALRVNAEGTLNVVRAVAEMDGGPVVVVAGSGDAYGRAGADPIREGAPLAPCTPYGASKAAQELVALAIGDGAVDVRVARVFPLVGPGQDEAFVVPSFARQARDIAEGRTEPLLHVGDLDMERDFTDVRDGARALLAIARLDRSRECVYNVCSGRALPVRRLLDWILEEAGVDPEVRVDPARVRPGEPVRIVGSPERLRQRAGWRVERDVRDAVREVYRRTGRTPAP